MAEQARGRQQDRYEYRENPAGKSIASFVLGIVSIVFFAVPVMLIAAVVGLLLERESERIGYHSLQPAARILCIVGIVLCSCAIVGFLVLIFIVGILAR